MRETQDALVRDALEATASVINCVGGANGDLPTEMTVSDVDDVVTTLQNNSGEYITNMIGGENKFGTAPIGDSYGVMLTTRMIPVLNNMSGFIRKFQYPNIEKTLATEWGGINNARFFVSEQGSVTPSGSLLGNDIANCFVAAKEGYKVVWQAGGKAKFIYLPPGYNNDPCIERSVQVKLPVIDLEGYGESYADKGQAGNVQAERLSLVGQFWHAIVRPTQRKVLKLAEMTSSLTRGVTIWLRHTAGCSFYQGQCIDEVVHLKFDLIDLESYDCVYT